MSSDTRASDEEAGTSDLDTETRFEPTPTSIQLYRLVWQLETWLREIVYVELRARDADWQAPIRAKVKGRPPHAQKGDKKLTHMVTSHQSAVSYLTLGGLWSMIDDAANWSLFAPYLPPQDILKARLKEVAQIRHRVAHFREPNPDDLSRLTLFLKDLDQGVWRFCTSYVTAGVRPPGTGLEDPVGDFIAAQWSRLTHGVELNGSDGRWQYSTTSDPALGVALRYSVRPWAQPAPGTMFDQPGLVYHASFTAMRGRTALPFDDILDRTQRVHKHCIHVKLEDRGSTIMSITIPAVLGEDVVRDTVLRFLDVARSTVRRRGPSLRKVRRVADAWPEYVLPPSNPLTFLSDGMPCPMFTLA